MSAHDADAFARRLEQQTAEDFHARKEGRKPRDFLHDGKANGAEPDIIAPGVFDARDWHGIERPTREFLDDRRWFRMGMASNLSGSGGIGKTLVALQACVAVASGNKWLGRDIRAGPAMFLSAEEPIEEMHIRVDEICEAEMLHLNQFEYPLEIIDTSWHLNAELVKASQTSKGMVMEVTPMFHWLKAKMLRSKPQVLFIDNRAQVIMGEENNRNVAGFATRMTGSLLARDTGAAVIMLSHPSMSGSKTGAAGSTQWFNAVRSNVFMSRPGHNEDDDDLKGDDGKRVLTNNKTNYAPLNSEANVLWEMNRWKCTDAPVTTSISKASQYDKAERVFMQNMHWCAEREIDLSDKTRSGDYAPKVFDKLPKEQREGLNETWFQKAMVSLFHQKKIKLVPGKRAGHSTKFLVVA